MHHTAINGTRSFEKSETETQLTIIGFAQKGKAAI